MNPYRIRYQLTEGKHYHDCQDVISHPLVVEAFLYGDFEGKDYDSIEWEGSIYQAEFIEYAQSRSNMPYNGEVFVGEWYRDVGDWQCHI